MSSVMIKNMTVDLHRRLKADAREHHRSMTKHVIAIIEEALGKSGGVGEAQPVKGRFPLTDQWLEVARRAGRP